MASPQSTSLTCSVLKILSHLLLQVIVLPVLIWLFYVNYAGCRFTIVLKSKIATMTHKAIRTGNPPYLANLVQWHTPCRTKVSLLLVLTYHLVLKVFARQLLLSGIVFPLTSVLAKLSQHSADIKTLIFSTQPFLVPHLSASDSFSTMALYKSIYLLTCSHYHVFFFLYAYKDSVHKWNL